MQFSAFQLRLALSALKNSPNRDLRAMADKLTPIELIEWRNALDTVVREIQKSLKERGL